MVSENECIVPELLSKDFFTKAIRNGNNSSNPIEIEDLTISTGSVAGDNYCSQIYRAIVTYKDLKTKKTHSQAVIVKYMPLDGEDRQFLKQMNIYQKEVIMFTEIMPRIERLMKGDEMFAPKCFYAIEKPINTIVMQDLKALDYMIADRANGLDEDHCRVLLWKLGQYHARSMVLAKQHPELMKPFNKGFFTDETVKSKMFQSIFMSNLSQIIKKISKMPNYDTIVKKLKNVQETFVERGLSCIYPKDGDIRVLNHGDLWVNNMMFKYKDNKPCDVVFIDLQISFYSGLGIDINYFLNTSVNLDVLKTKRYQLLRHYYMSLKRTLETLDYSPIPTWDDVKREINDKEFMGFAAMEGVMPIIAMNRNDCTDNSIETFCDESKLEQKLEIMFENKRVIDTLEYSLDRFDELGLFD